MAAGHLSAMRDGAVVPPVLEREAASRVGEIYAGDVAPARAVRSRIRVGHVVVGNLRQASILVNCCLRPRKARVPGVSLEAPERAMLMDMRGARPFPVFFCKFGRCR